MGLKYLVHLCLFFVFVVSLSFSQDSEENHNSETCSKDQANNRNYENSIEKRPKTGKRPHIIFILADDAGWNDFSFHGSPQIPTPNIDAIALNGVILNSYYSAPLCTPSRGSMLTGKYPIHIALQHYVITSGTVNGLPLTEKLLPEYLKELGYDTHLVGKWHLGHASKVYTPTFRGFDSHFGYYLGKQDYYSHMVHEKYGKGYDFRNNLTVDYDSFGYYNTDLFTDEAIRLIQQKSNKKENGDSPLFLMLAHTAPHSSEPYDPLQAPEENVAKFDETIQDENRKKYAGIVDKLDESVGRVVNALAEQNMLENSIIIFASDNGGAPEGYDLNYGSNWPLRGTKNTLWEGGTRLSACLWSPKLKPHVHTAIMHSTDWLPTLLHAAQGGPVSFDNLDGVSQWEDLITPDVQSPPRNEFIYNIDDSYNNSAVRYGPWKLIRGNTSSTDLDGCPQGSCDSWFGPSGRDPVTSQSNPNSNSSVKNGSHSIKSVGDLIPLILNSVAGKAFEKAGFPIDERIAREMQVAADLGQACDQSDGDGDDDGNLCDALSAPCLFNIEQDPCEKRNLAAEHPETVAFLLKLIESHNRTAIPPIRRWNDPNCRPSKWGYIWTFFKDLVP